MAITVERFVRSWDKGPGSPRCKIHYSSPNTNFREVKRKNKKTGKPETIQVPPIWTGHADYVNPFEFATFMRMVADAGDFDVMLEAKAKDLSLLRLRRDLPRYAPDVAVRFGLQPAPPDATDDDIVEELEDAAAGE